MATSLSHVAPAFVDMAHRIVWCTAATVDRANRPRSRVLHPIWEWGDGPDSPGFAVLRLEVTNAQRLGEQFRMLSQPWRQVRRGPW